MSTGSEVEFLFFNVFDLPTKNNRPINSLELHSGDRKQLKESLERVDAIVAIGKTAYSFICRRYDEAMVMEMPHPSGLNRQLNDPAFVEEKIKKLAEFISELSFNLKDFYATEAALTFAMIAYNLMALFRTLVLQEKTQKTLSTLRCRTFAIAAYFEKLNGKLVLKIALNKKRRQSFSGLWNYSKVFDYPFQLPIA